MRLSNILLALTVLATQGCRALVEPTIRFPIGIYGVTRVEELARLKELGFDSFHTYEQEPNAIRGLAEEAIIRDMDMVIYPDQVLRSTFPIQAVKWPVAAWYLVDEPDVQKWSVDKLTKIHDAVKNWSPMQKTTFVIGQGSSAERFGAIGDVMMLDWYPVPHLPLETIADQIDIAYSHLPKGKPLWAVIQAYDWRDESTSNPKATVGRFPEFSEIRFMSYAAIVHGAKGIYYFTLKKPGGKTLFDIPEEFQAVYRVVWELKGLQPILEHGKPIPIPFRIKTKDMEAMALRYRMRDYIIILNRRGDAMVKMPEDLLQMKWRPLFETRRYVKELLTEAKGAWYLQPYRVMVFESRLRL